MRTQIMTFNPKLIMKLIFAQVAIWCHCLWHDSLNCFLFNQIYTKISPM